MRTVPSMPLARLLTLLAAVVLATVLLVTWLDDPSTGRIEGAAGREASGAKPVNEGAHQLITRPDLHPASVTVTLDTDDATPGYYFVTQGSPRYGGTGPLIVDRLGRPVWLGQVPEGRNATTFEVQSYQSRPVLTWWEGRIDKDVGMGIGQGVILDQSYREVARVQAGNDRPTDLHDFVITPRDTALLLIYQPRSADLSEYGGKVGGRVLDNLVQEVDIATGEVLFEWSAFDAVPPDESYQPVPDGTDPWDAYHLNSVIVDEAGDLLVSARHTWAVYKIDGRTGDVLWRLGGKKSDFTLGPGALFTWQHDADWRADGTLTLFDNQAASPELVESDHSRGLILRLDETAGTAGLVRELTHPAGLLAPSQGNLQNLPDGHVLVGWGSEPHFSEYDERGRMVFDARFFETAQSYRAFLFDWTGAPAGPPVVVATTEQEGARVSVSWNGATEVRAWRVLGAASEGAEPVELATAPWAGLETSILVDQPGPWFVVEALDAAGAVIGTSDPVRATTASPSPSASTSPSAPSPSP
jgi:hypothetical protein